MKFKKPVVTTIFLAVWLSGCTHYYYVANVQNVPLFKEKNEFRLSGAYGFGDYSECTEVQAAYSITEKFGVMTNFMSAKGGDVSNNDDWANGNYFDGAIGYYKPIERSGVFEIYGGLGGSNQHHHYGNEGTADLSFIKLFVQPSFGFTFNAFDIAVSTRLCSLSFNKIENYIYGNPNLYSELSAIANNNYLFLEPAITFRGGWKYVKLQVQAAYANVFNKSDLSFIEQPHISIGLYIAIAERYR